MGENTVDSHHASSSKETVIISGTESRVGKKEHIYKKEVKEKNANGDGTEGVRSSHPHTE